MARTVRDVMTANPVMLDDSTPLVEAARAMRDRHIGDVFVMRGGSLAGIVTDRDIVVRAVAAGRELGATQLGDVCSADLVTLSPDDTIDAAAQRMRERAVRRVPVVDGDRPVGVVSIGGLAIERDPQSALADISSAPGNR